ALWAGGDGVDARSAARPPCRCRHRQRHGLDQLLAAARSARPLRRHARERRRPRRRLRVPRVLHRDEKHLRKAVGWSADASSAHLSDEVLVRKRAGIPHWHVPNGVYFVTFRLADSMPRSVVFRLAEMRTLLRKEGAKQFDSE